MTMVCLGWRRYHITATELSTRETSVASAAPTTPMWKPKISTAFPMMLIRLHTMEISIGRRELPSTRNSAAPAL